MNLVGTKKLKSRMMIFAVSAVMIFSYFGAGCGDTVYAMTVAKAPHVIKAGDTKLAVVGTEAEAEAVIKDVIDEYTANLDSVKSVEVTPKIEAEPAFLGGSVAMEPAKATATIIDNNDAKNHFEVTATGEEYLEKVIKHKRVVKKIKTMKSGKREVVREGEDGQTNYTKERTYVNGQLTESEIIDKEVVKEPVTEVIHKGVLSGSAVVEEAKKYIGNPYVYGGTSLTNGTDCSGFTMRIYEKFGKSLPRTSYDQRFVGVEVPYSQAKPGDIICYSGHVAIYAGNGKIVHAANPRKDICIGSATYARILTVRRIIN